MRYHNIITDNMNNGDGLRVVLFVAGCSHHCKNCHNPETWNPDGGIEFTAREFLEITNELDKEYISGLTFSGGDPLHPANIREITKLARIIKEKYPNKTVWLYTGFMYEQVSDLEIMQYIDVLVDGEFVEGLADVNYHWCGSVNQRVIDIPNTRKERKVVLYESK